MSNDDSDGDYYCLTKFNHYFKTTCIERGDHLRTCVSTRVLHLFLLVVVVIEGIANTHHLAENPIKQSPLRNVSTRGETDATAILPISHPVNGVCRLLAVAASKPVGDKDLFPAETNYHVLHQNLLAAAAVLLAAAATICLRRPHNLQKQWTWGGWLAPSGRAPPWGGWLAPWGRRAPPWGRQWGGGQWQASCRQERAAEQQLVPPWHQRQMQPRHAC